MYYLFFLRHTIAVLYYKCLVHLLKCVSLYIILWQILDYLLMNFSKAQKLTLKAKIGQEAGKLYTIILQKV